MKEADVVPDPTFFVASVSLPVPGKGGASGTRMLLPAGRPLRLSFMQTGSCLQFLSQTVRGSFLPTMSLHLPN